MLEMTFSSPGKNCSGTGKRQTGIMAMQHNNENSNN